MPDYAGFGERAAAFLLDWLLATIVTVPIVVLGFGVRRVSLDPAEHSWDLLGFLVLAALVIGFWRYCGATPGKSAFGLKIVDAKSGGAPGTARLALRFAAYFVSALPLYIGFLWIAFDRKKQGWHDKIAGTVVISSED